MTTPKTRYSKQRELIYNNLKDRHDHPTAEIIYADLKKTNPNLSMGTVYRNLNYLVENHMIRKLDFGEQVVHYDGNTSDHYHFICQECHEIIDIYHEKSDNLTMELQKLTDHNISYIDLTLVGTCQNCQKKKH